MFLLTPIQKNDVYNCKLITEYYKPQTANEIIVGSLALSKETNELFLINDEIKKIEIELENHTGDFVSKNQTDLFRMYIIHDNTKEIITNESGIGLIKENNNLIPIQPEHINFIINNKGSLNLESGSDNQPVFFNDKVIIQL